MFFVALRMLSGVNHRRLSKQQLEQAPRRNLRGRIAEILRLVQEGQACSCAGECRKHSVHIRGRFGHEIPRKSP